MSRERIEILEKQLNALSKTRSLTYDDITEIVEYLASIKSRQFGEIGVYNLDDVAQEIRLKCASIIKKFVPGEYSVFNFLGRCIDNYLKDLRRRHTLRRTNVCCKCVYYQRGKCFLHGENIKKCFRYNEFLKHKKQKESISYMQCDPEFAWHMHVGDIFLCRSVAQYEDAIKELCVVLPADLVLPFKMVLAGSGIDEEIREELYDEVKSAIRYTLDW